jgi:hypothetical protein
MVMFMVIPQIDRKVLEHLCFYSKDERDTFLKLMPLVHREPAVIVALAIFRDSLVFREMAQAEILNLRLEVKELEKRLEKLEPKEE